MRACFTTSASTPCVRRRIVFTFFLKNTHKIFLFFSKYPLDKSEKHGIIRVTKGKKSKTFSLGTTQIQRSTQICSLPTQNNLRRFFPEMCTWDTDARVKRKAERKFRSGTDERKRRAFFSHLGYRERLPDEPKSETVSRPQKREVLYVQIGFEKTCLKGGRSNVRFDERNYKIE